MRKFWHDYQLVLIYISLVGLAVAGFFRVSDQIDANRTSIVRNTAILNASTVLGEYPIQVVESTVEGVDGPAVKVGETLNVTAVKCGGEKTVAVSGSLSWQSVDPQGTLVKGGSGVGERTPGCQVFRYENPLPDEVVARSIEVYADTGAYMRWQLSGKETPTGGEGRVYFSETFVVVP